MTEARPVESPAIAPADAGGGRAGRFARIVPIVVVLAVLAVRSVYWAALEGSALSDWHRWTETDEYSNLEWSARIAGGSWLDAPAYRGWASWQGAYGTQEAWDGWYQRNVYFQGVLYTYFLAAVRRAAGFPVVPVRLLQLLLASVTAGVVAAAVRAVLVRARSRVRGFSGWGVAVGPLAAGLSYGLFSPLVFHDGFLLRDGPFAHLSALLVALALMAEAPRPRSLVLLGLLGGATALLKQTGLPLALLAVAVVAAKGEKGRRTLLAATGVAALLLPLGCLFARNVAVGAPTFAFDTRGQVCLAWSCARGANGTNTPSPLLGTILSRAGGSTGSVVRQVAESWRGDLAGLAGLELRKAATFFHRYEIADNANFSFFRDRLPVLAFLPVFACLLGPGLVGLGSASANRLLSAGEAALVWGGFLFPFASCLLVSTTSRYRAAVAGPLAIGLGLGLAALLTLGADRAGLRRAAPAVALAVLVSLVPLLPPVVPTPRATYSDALVAATLAEARGSGEAGAIEIGRYLREGTDDPLRPVGILAVQAWLAGERAHAQVEAGSVAPPGKRFRLPR